MEGSILEYRKPALEFKGKKAPTKIARKARPRISSNPAIPYNAVSAIHQDPDGTMWVGTREGVSRYDGERFINFTIANGLPSHRISKIYRDRNGIMWFGTRDSGVCRYDGVSFTTLTTEDGLATH